MKVELNVLLIEDDTIEVMKLNRTITKLKLNHKIVIANNGEEALKTLKVDNFLPDIILLDLNMPKMNGIEFLSILKSDENLRYIPAIILTTSKNQKETISCLTYK